MLSLFTLPRLIAFAAIGSFLLLPIMMSYGGHPDMIFSAWCAALTAFLLRRCFINWKKARLIEDTPTSKIRSAAQGYVEFCGIAKGLTNQPLLLAPLTQKPCVWYRFTIEKFVQSERQSTWRIIQSGQSSQWFELDDSTGRCLINPTLADTTSLLKQRWQGDIPVATFSSTSRSFQSEYRFTEWRIHPEDFIYTLGHLTSYQGASLSEQIEHQRTEILESLKADRQTLLTRYDSNQDGEISAAEWERARRHARHAAEKQILQQASTPTLPVLGANDAHPEQPFILSTTDPKFLTRQYRWAAFGSALGFVLCSIGLVWFIQRLLNMTAV